jgi:hypothetical protein
MTQSAPEETGSSALVNDAGDLQFRFNVGTKGDGKVYAALTMLDDDGGSCVAWAIDEFAENNPTDFLTSDIDIDHMMESSLSESDTKEELLALGYEFSDQVFMWYRPEELKFLVEQDVDAGEDMRCWVFVEFDPDHPNAMYSDTIGESVMHTVPDFLNAGNRDSECMWTLDDSKSIKYYTDIMLRLGFVLDPFLISSNNED